MAGMDDTSPKRSCSSNRFQLSLSPRDISASTTYFHEELHPGRATSSCLSQALPLPSSFDSSLGTTSLSGGSSIFPLERGQGNRPKSPVLQKHASKLPIEEEQGAQVCYCEDGSSSAASSCHNRKERQHSPRKAGSLGTVSQTSGIWLQRGTYVEFFPNTQHSLACGMVWHLLFWKCECFLHRSLDLR